MKKNLFILIPALLVGISALSGCQKENTPIDNNPKLTVYKSDSVIVLGSFADNQTMPLTTYHWSPCGDIPYVKLNDFVNIVRLLGSQMMVVRTGVGIYELVNRDETCVRIDTDLDNMFIMNMDRLMSDLCPYNSDVGMDLANPNDSEVSAVHTSINSHNLDGFDDEVYRFKEYGFDFVDQDNHCYVPAQLIANIIFRNLNFDLVYNGIDFYLSSLVLDQTQLGNYCSYRSSDHSFYMNDMVFRKAEAVQGEKYRYLAQVDSPTATVGKYHFLSFKPDGTGEYLVGPNPDSVGSSVSLSTTIRLKWQEKRDGLYTHLYLSPLDSDVVKEDYGIIKIAYDKGYFATGKRSKEIANYSYNLLKLQFDRFYGLKEQLVDKYGHADFDTFVEEENLKDNLLSEDTTKYDEALAKYTMQYIDDGHTNYMGTSIYSVGVGKAATALSSEYAGTRYQSLFAYQDTYLKLRKSVLSSIDEKYKDTKEQQNLFMEGKTAAIRFDSFVEPMSFILNEETTATSISDALTTSVSAGFDLAFKEINNNENIENIVIDLTCNGGGQILLLPYLSAFFTSYPSFQIKDTVTGVRKNFCYEVDLNHDGLYSDGSDTYEGKYNFYILTSELSFSCANALSTIAKNNGITIIGKKSGGGSCPVAFFSDGCGSLYTTSSNYQFCLCDDLSSGNYYCNDGGVPVDYNLDSDAWYDMVRLNAFVTSLNN